MFVETTIQDIWDFTVYWEGGPTNAPSMLVYGSTVGIPNASQRWNRQAIDKLLSNEKYAGRVLLQRTYTKEGKQIRDTGQETKYLYSNNHPAIISEDMFNYVQAEKQSRSPAAHCHQELSL